MGVCAHHWNVGNILAVEGITHVDIKVATAYNLIITTSQGELL